MDGYASPPNHVAQIENTCSDRDNPDVLALKAGLTTHPSSKNSFITFFNGNDDSLGSIVGNGSGGGVVFAGPGNDFAEWLPKPEPGEEIQPGQIVGIFNGKATRRTQGADLLLVASSGEGATVYADWSALSPDRRLLTSISPPKRAPSRRLMHGIH